MASTGWRERAAANRPFVQCKGCGTSFQPRGVDRTQFCSRECAFAYKTAHRLPPDRRKRAPAQPKVACCAVCSGSFETKTGATVCSKPCAIARARAASREHNRRKVGEKRHVCRECGVTFEPAYGIKQRTYCSEQCANRSGRRPARLARKARQRAVTVETVDPIKVFERDRWTCQLCGIKAPRRLRGSFDDQAPELDHIVPLSKGGEHSYRNTQCACRKCNAAKGDTLLGQMRLFG